MKHHVNSQVIKDLVLSEIVKMVANGEYEVTIKKLPKTRTGQQRKAIEVYCSLLADAFNEAGLTVQAVLEKTLDCDWNQSMVKDAIFKKATGRILDKDSTTKLSSSEVTIVYDTVNRFAAQFGIHVAFPVDKTKKEIN